MNPKESKAQAIAAAGNPDGLPETRLPRQFGLRPGHNSYFDDFVRMAQAHGCMTEFFTDGNSIGHLTWRKS